MGIILFYAYFFKVCHIKRTSFEGRTPFEVQSYENLKAVLKPPPANIGKIKTILTHHTHKKKPKTYYSTAES